MEAVGELAALYEEIHSHYAARDPELVPRRIIPGALDSRVLLLGQALGRDTQRLSGVPYCLPPPTEPRLSRGGRELDRFLTLFGYTILPGGSGQYAYHTDLAHYFPGRKHGGTGDEKPAPEEVERNREWLEHELTLIDPRVVIPLGLQATSVFLQRYANRAVGGLREVAATAIPCTVLGRSLTVVPVHHPSGAFQHPSSRDTYERAAELVRVILAQS